MSIKQFFYILTILFSQLLFGQDSVKDIEVLLSQERIEDASKLIEASLKNDSINSKLWYYKGLITQRKIEIYTPSAQKKKILDSALFCYNLAMKFDDNRVLETLLSETLIAVSQQYAYTGMELFNEAKYKTALIVFEQSISTLSTPFVNQLDTMVYYSVAMSAEKSNNYTKAEFYYTKIIEYYPTDWNSIISLANIYKLQNKNKEYLALIKRTNAKYPEVEIFYKELIGYYLENKNQVTAMLYLNKVIKISNDDKLLYLKGSILQDQGEIIEAKKYYYKCLELNPNSADALYNLSAIEYNLALDILNSTHKTKAEKKLLNEYLTKSVEYLVLVKQLEPTNRNVFLMLISCYQQLGLEDNEARVKKELENMSN